MRIIEELLKIKSIEDNEKYFSALESIILKLRYERKYFNISYDSSYFEGINQHSQFSYIIPTWCFLYYQNKQFHSVIGLIESFLSYEFGFLNEIDIQRTSSGAMRCSTNFRFAANYLKKKEIVNKEKFKTWEAYKLTNEGVSRWNEIEQYFNDKQVSKSQVLNDLTSSFDFDFQSNKNIINKIKDTFIKREEIKKG